MKERFRKDYFIVWAISVFYGIIVIPLDFLISAKSSEPGSVKVPSKSKTTALITGILESLI